MSCPKVYEINFLFPREKWTAGIADRMWPENRDFIVPELFIMSCCVATMANKFSFLMAIVRFFVFPSNK
jgi:hypothetical protein